MEGPRGAKVLDFILCLLSFWLLLLRLEDLTLRTANKFCRAVKGTRGNIMEHDLSWLDMARSHRPAARSGRVKHVKGK